MDSELQLPDDFNGVIEVGISAGVDEITDPTRRISVLSKYVYHEGFKHATAALGALLAVVKEYNADTTEGKTTIDPTLFTPDVCTILGVSNQSDIPGTSQLDPSNYREEKIDMLHTLACLEYRSEEDEAQALYVACVAYLIQSGMIIGPLTIGNRYVSYLSVADSERYITETRNAYTKEEVQKMIDTAPRAGSLAGLVVATKVSWWLTNHHVGQVSDQIASYAGKFFKTLELPGSVAAYREVIWALGKYTVTRRTLAQLGVENILEDGADDLDIPLKEFSFTASVDVAMRISSRPAGTARTTTPLAITAYAKRSMFAIALPHITNYDAVVLSNSEMLNAPARYHMGAHFLTGSNQVMMETFNEEDFENISAWIHAVAPKGNLAKANVLTPHEQVQGSLVYTLITNIKLSLVTAGSDLVLMECIKRISGGAAGLGGFALQVGQITAEEIEDAKAKVGEEEKSSGKQATE